jgi:hypothetical protein
MTKSETQTRIKSFIVAKGPWWDFVDMFTQKCQKLALLTQMQKIMHNKRS